MEKEYNLENFKSEKQVSETAAVYFARSGMKPTIFIDLSFLSGFTKEELAQYFNITSKTILRYLNSGKTLDPFTSEHAIALKNLYLVGAEVFENLDYFRSWLKKPNYGLGNMVPQELMKTPGGLRLVKEEILRIEYGATA